MKDNFHLERQIIVSIFNFIPALPRGPADNIDRSPEISYSAREIIRCLKMPNVQIVIPIRHLSGFASEVYRLAYHSVAEQIIYGLSKASFELLNMKSARNFPDKFLDRGNRRPTRPGGCIPERASLLI